MEPKVTAAPVSDPRLVVFLATFHGGKILSQTAEDGVMISELLGKIHHAVGGSEDMEKKYLGIVSHAFLS